MFLPIVRQFTTDRLAPQRTQLPMFLVVLLDLRVPFSFVFSAAIDCFPEMGQRLFRHIELLVFRPTEMTLGLTHCLFTGSVTVSFAGPGCRHPVANDGL